MSTSIPSDIKESIITFNELLGHLKDYENTWVIDAAEITPVKQIAAIWERRYGKGTYPGEFFDHPVSGHYFGLMWPDNWSCGASGLARSPADFILFSKKQKNFPTNQWIERTKLLVTIFDQNIDLKCLPPFYSLKICAPGTTFYQLLCLITSMSQSFVENEVQDRLFFEELVLHSGKPFQWRNIPIIQVNAEL